MFIKNAHFKLPSISILYKSNITHKLILTLHRNADFAIAIKPLSPHIYFIVLILKFLENMFEFENHYTNYRQIPTLRIAYAY